MIKKILSTFLLLVFVCSSVYALSSNIKSEYNPKETAIIKIDGNIADNIDESQVYIKRANVFVPVEYEVERIGKNWYVWFVNPEINGNYTLYIDNVETINNFGNPVKENYRQDFKVVGNITDYNIKPGFVKTNSDFIITLTVFDANREVEIKFANQERVEEVSTGINNIEFSIANIKNTSSYSLEIGKYNSVAYVIIPGSVEIEQMEKIEDGVNQTNQNETIVNNTNNSQAQIEELNLDIYPNYIERVLYSGAENAKYNFTIINPRNKEYENVVLIYNKSLFKLEPEEFEINKNSSFMFNISILKFGGEEIDEIVYINGSDFYFEVPILLRYVGNVSDVVEFYGGTVGNNTNKTKTAARCTELGGYVCSAETKCSGQILNSIEGDCCWSGKCLPLEKQGSSAWIGWLIALVVLGGLWFLYYKYSEAGKIGGSPVSASIPKGP